MNINRHNYEEFFLFYTDNELSAAEKLAVESFVQANPDLEEEFRLFRQLILVPDAQVQLDHKEDLQKQVTALHGITEQNYEEYFLLYADQELSAPECAQVQAFVQANPSLETTFRLLQQARMIPDTGLQFSHKHLLYKEDSRVVGFGRWRMAAAAAVLLLAGLGWWMMAGRNADDSLVAGAKKENDSTGVTNQVADRNTIIQPVDKRAQQKQINNQIPMEEDVLREEANDQQTGKDEAPVPQVAKTDPVITDPLMAGTTDPGVNNLQPFNSDVQPQKADIVRNNGLYTDPAPRSGPQVDVQQLKAAESLESSVSEAPEAPSVYVAGFAVKKDSKLSRLLNRKAKRFIEHHKPLAKQSAVASL
jgi:anti-sigma factor RsiW